METLRMTGAQAKRWEQLMVDVRKSVEDRTASRKARGLTLKELSDTMKSLQGSLYTVVRLGRIFRGALQVDANGFGKDVSVAACLIGWAEQDGRLTPSQHAELIAILGLTATTEVNDA